MAGDLIPPRSPAGRPSPDPDPSVPLVAGEEHVQAAPEPSSLPPSPFRARFGFVTGALLGCLLAAGVLLAMLLTGGGSPAERGLARDWSTWKPTTSDTISGAQEIAARIERTYRNEKRQQLAKVTGGPIALGLIPLSVALPVDGNIEVLDGVGIQYTLAGLGKEGRLQGSKPSKARHRLLRREALELALYSFRYLPEVTMVVALLPPAPRAEQIHPKPKGSKKAARAAKAAAKAEKFQTQAMFFRPGDLKQQLQVPLPTTLAPTPPALDELDGEEARKIDTLTLSNLFEYRRVQQQDGRVYLVLERPS